MSALDLIAGLSAEQEPAKLDNTQTTETVSLEVLLQWIHEEQEQETFNEAVAIANLEDALDTIESNVAHLEGHLATMHAAIADGGISKETFNAVATTIVEQCGVVGHQFVTVATESIDKPGGKVEAAEYSAESIKKAIEKGWIATQRFFAQLIAKVMDFLKRIFTKAGRFKAKVKNLAELEKQLKGTPGDAKVEVPALMHEGKGVITTGQLNEFVKYLGGIAKSKPENSIKAIGDAYKSVDVSSEASIEAGKSAIDSAINGLANELMNIYEVKSVVGVDDKLLPKESEYAVIKGKAILGNRRLVIGAPGGKSDRMPFIKILPDKEQVKGGGEIPALTKDQIGKFAKSLEEMLGYVEDMSDNTLVKAAEKAFDDAKTMKDKLIKADAEIDGLMPLFDRVKQARQLAKVAREPSLSLSNHAIEIGTVIYNVAVRSAKAHKE